MKILFPDSKRVAEFVNKHKECLMVEYSGRISRVVDAKLHANKHDLVLELRQLKGNYADLRQRTCLKDIVVIANCGDRVKIVKARFFYFG